MQRILIVEDNKTLAKLIAKKIAAELSYEVDVAYNLSEAKLFLKKYNYFITLLDLNLPDAPHGEIVDYVLKTNNRAIVLSANIDKEFRKKMLQKNIIDYVNKSGVNDVNYIIQTIKRLQKNQDHTILVVDDSLVFRKQMQNMLENMFYRVITVAHGEEALGMLQSNPNISLVITDYNMPVINGLDLVIEIRKTYAKSDLGIIALSSNNDDEITALFLKNGANDYIKKPFTKEEFSCRINNSIEALENIHIITNQAKRDFLTGLYNRKYFYADMKKYFQHALHEMEPFVLATLDIDNFKSINEKYGQESGDAVITHLADILRANTNPEDLIARFSAQEFWIAFKNTSANEALETLEKIRHTLSEAKAYSNKNEPIAYTISIGVLLSPEESLEESLNQADMLLFNAKQNGKNQLLHN
ncbi:MAG: diguanylate cyclase [Sulfurimonas sp.]|jgi:diguanylate cyclase (GGDEF)-like protein|nr:diguanylate cyclase [Sulfurimonas sp.]